MRLASLRSVSAEAGLHGARLVSTPGLGHHLRPRTSNLGRPHDPRARYDDGRPDHRQGRARGPRRAEGSDAAARPRTAPRQGGRRGRQPPRRAAAQGALSRPQGALGGPGPGDCGRGRRRRQRRRALQAGRARDGARQRRRIRRVLPRRGAGLPADPGPALDHRGGGPAGDVLHGLAQRVRARPPEVRRVVHGPRRHVRDRRHRDPARQGVRVQGDRDRRLGGEMRSLPRARGRTAPSTTRARTSSRR